MNINGKVHCFFEQSGTFKREFIKLGIPAEDYDIQNNFGETDHVIDLFNEIEKAYQGGVSTFDSISCDDLILSFFPCIYFCDNNVLYFSGTHKNYEYWGMNKEQIIDNVLERSQKRQQFYEILLKMFAVCERKQLRMIFENPFSLTHYLHNNFPYTPAFIDRNRRQRGDYFKKPTQYYYLNCTPTYGRSIQEDKPQKSISKLSGRSDHSGLCSEERSMISPDYARNFICDFIIGKEQQFSERQLFP